MSFIKWIENSPQRSSVRLSLGKSPEMDRIIEVKEHDTLDHHRIMRNYALMRSELMQIKLQKLNEFIDRVEADIEEKPEINTPEFRTFLKRLRLKQSYLHDVIPLNR